MRATLFILAALVWQSSLALQIDPAKLPAKDQHQNFLVAAIPYSDAKVAKVKLNKIDAIKAGLLPVEVFLRNDTKDPVHVNLNTIQLDIDAPNAQRLHLRRLSLEQAASDIAHPKGPSAPSARRFPPIIGVPLRDSKQRDMMDRLQPLVFQTDIVPPGKTVHGFLFFDLNHNYDLVPFASLYVPDVKSIASPQALIYFEVPLKGGTPQ
jgi:hypothetical protein